MKYLNSKGKESKLNQSMYRKICILVVDLMNFQLVLRLKKNREIEYSEAEAEDNSVEFYNEVLARIPNSNKTYSATNIVRSYPYQKRKTTNHNKNKRSISSLV